MSKQPLEQQVTHQIIKTIRDGKEEVHESYILLMRNDLYPTVGTEVSLSVSDAMELYRLLDNKLGGTPL